MDGKISCLAWLAGWGETGPSARTTVTVGLGCHVSLLVSSSNDSVTVVSAPAPWHDIKSRFIKKVISISDSILPLTRMVYAVKDLADFNAQLEAAGGKLVVVDFFATW